MQRIRLEARVPAELAGMRVDRAAAQLFADYSRASLSRWIQEGALRVNEEAVKPKSRLFGGELLRVDAAVEQREDWDAAEPIDFRVVYEDAHLLVIDKPAGLVVHPGAGNRSGTLVNGLLNYRPDLALLPRAGIVHRLDKDTSGLMLVAATLPAQHALGKMMSRREVSRRYLAVVEGQLVGGMDIDQPIGRDPGQRTRQAVRADGRPARTRVRVLERYRAHTLIEATLETGRTHQIRVHLASVGYPLVGDSRYGARGRLPVHPDVTTVEVVRSFRRQALYAWKLGFTHPESGEPLEFNGDPPGDLQQLMDTLADDARRNVD